MKYYHRYAGAKFFMPNGKDISFAGGEFDSSTVKDPDDRKAVELELNKIANVPSAMIYTKDSVADSSEAAVHDEIMGGAEVAFDQTNKIAAGAKTVALPQAHEGKPTLNNAASKATATTATGQSMADKLAEARQKVAEAAAAQAGQQNQQHPDSSKK